MGGDLFMSRVVTSELWLSIVLLRALSGGMVCGVW